MSMSDFEKNLISELKQVLESQGKESDPTFFDRVVKTLKNLRDKDHGFCVVIEEGYDHHIGNVFFDRSSAERDLVRLFVEHEDLRSQLNDDTLRKIMKLDKNNEDQLSFVVSSIQDDLRYNDDIQAEIVVMPIEKS